MIEIARVRTSRNMTNPTFPLPDIRACIEYGITEGAGEYKDADLRMRQPEHLRNNARNVDPRAEWGQCGYMLMSAWIQMRPDQIMEVVMPPFYDITEAYIDTVREMANALGDVNIELRADGSLLCALVAWKRMCILQGWDSCQLIDETCSAFERKHCKVEVQS